MLQSLNSFILILVLFLREISNILRKLDNLLLHLFNYFLTSLIHIIFYRLLF